MARHSLECLLHLSLEDGTMYSLVEKSKSSTSLLTVLDGEIKPIRFLELSHALVNCVSL